MILYPLFIKISDKVSSVSELTTHLLKSSGRFYSKSSEFIAELIKISETSNLYITADLALSLDKLLTFKVKKESQNAVRSSSSKEKDRFAVEVLEEVLKAVKEFQEKPRKTFEECEDIWRQVLARLLARGMQRESLPPSGEERLNHIIQITKEDPELSPYYSHIMGLCGEVNARVLLDITMPSVGL
ncbi:MAG: hypothetical protein R3Y45_09205 [Bacillota bacterium]